MSPDSTVQEETPNLEPKWPQKFQDLDVTSPLRSGLIAYVQKFLPKGVCITDESVPQAKDATETVAFDEALTRVGLEVRSSVDFALHAVRETDKKAERPYVDKENPPIHLRWMIHRDLNAGVLKTESEVASRDGVPDWKYRGVVTDKPTWTFDDFKQINKQRTAISMVADTDFNSGNDDSIGSYLTYRLYGDSFAVENLAIGTAHQGNYHAELWMNKLLEKMNPDRRRLLSGARQLTVAKAAEIISSSELPTSKELCGFFAQIEDMKGFSAEMIRQCKAALSAALGKLPKGDFQVEFVRMLQPVLTCEDDPAVFKEQCRLARISVRSLRSINEDLTWFMQNEVQLDDLTQANDKSAVAEIRQLTANQVQVIRHMLGISRHFTAEEEQALGFVWHTAIAPEGDSVGHLQMAEDESTGTLQVRRFTGGYDYCGPCSQQVYTRLLTMVLKALNDNPNLKAIVDVVPVKFADAQVASVEIDNADAGEQPPEMAARFKGTKKNHRISSLISPTT